MVLEFITLFSVGSVIGSLLVRFLYRKFVGEKLTNLKVNLSRSTNRKFRIIELIPFLGTALTHIKHQGENRNVAKYAFGMELLYGLTLFLTVKIYDFTSTWQVVAPFIYFCLISYIYYHIVADVEDLIADEETEIKNNGQTLTVIPSSNKRPKPIKREMLANYKN